MKKTFKRAGVAVLSMAMLLSMGAVGAISANAAYVADGTVKVTLNAPTTYENAVYKVYKVADATVATSTSYHYTVLAPFNTVAEYDTDTEIAAQTTESQKKTMADAFAAKVGATTPVVATLYGNSGAGATSANLDPGYYLIVTETTGTTMTASNILTTLIYDDSESSHVATFNPKTSQPSITKEIAGTSSTIDGTYTATSVGTAKDTADVAIGEYVEYQIKVTVPQYNPTVTSITQDFYVTDDPAKGLTLDSLSNVSVYNTNDTSAVPVSNTTAATPVYGYTIAAKAAKDANHSAGFTVTFDDDYVIANGGDEIVITYKAQVNANALTGTAGNTNIATLSYDNDYDTGSATNPTQPTDTATVYTAELKVIKTGDAGAALAGAGFTLFSDAACTSAVTSEQTTTITAPSTDAIATFTGLKAGVYYLKETTVPADYKEANVVKVTIAAKGNDDANYSGNYTFAGQDNVTNGAITISVDTDHNGSVTIENIKGKTLPGTGGMGTIMFTVGGAAIILFAGVMFVLYMRKRRSEEE